MAHTPEQRDQMPLCGAKKKNGELCRAFAGQSTDHPGVGRCKFHLGNTKNHQVNAVVQEVQRRMVKFGMPIEVHPHDALLHMLYLASGAVAWLHGEIGALDDLGTFEARVLVQCYSDERDRVAKVAKYALEAGVAEREVRLAEEHGEQLYRLLSGIFGDAELGLSLVQQERLPEVARRHLIRMDEQRTLVA